MRNVRVPLADVPEGSSVGIDFDGTKVLLLRSEGRVYAYEDKCPHAFWPLSQGAQCGGVLECPGHGWEFAVETGVCLTSPSYNLKPVPFEIVGGNIVLQREESSPVHSIEPAAPACS